MLIIRRGMYKYIAWYDIYTVTVRARDSYEARERALDKFYTIVPFDVTRTQIRASLRVKRVTKETYEAFR